MLVELKRNPRGLLSKIKYPEKWEEFAQAVDFHHLICVCRDNRQNMKPVACQINTLVNECSGQRV